MKRPTQSRPVTGTGLSRPVPSRGIPRPEVPSPPDEPPHRGGAAAERPLANDETLPAHPASDLGIPRKEKDEQLFAGRYRIERKLGRGGMGSVFLATQLAVDRKVAIKVLENVSEDGVMVARFQREARVIAQLQHPNIVNLIDFGENERGQLYLVMEFIDGEALTGLIKREAPLDPARVVQIALQITEALAAAHDISVIHRDLKPDNIMMLGGGGRRDYAKILDFGIAKVKRSDPGHQDTVQTRAGLIVGSLRYISPEQVESKEVTVRTDFYALGGILYELLTGRRVFDYASPADCAIAHLTEPPKPPTLDGAPVTGPLVDLIMQCLEKQPDRRPPNAHVVSAMLRGCEHAPIHAPAARAPSDPYGTLPTREQADVHASATQLELHPSGARVASQPAFPAAAAAATALPPLSRPVSRPIARGAAESPSPIEHTVTAMGQGAVGDRSLTDCSIDLPRRSDGATSGPVADLSMWSAPGAGDPAHTVTHHAAIPHPGARPPGRGAHPILWVLALIGLAGIGALIYIVACGQGGGGGGPVPNAGPASSLAVPHPDPPPQPAPAVPTVVAEEPDVVTPEVGADTLTASAPDVATPDTTAPDGEPAAEAPPASPPVAANAVRIASEPELAEVFLGELSLGTTPVNLTWDGKGAAPRLRVVKPGHRQLRLTLRRADVGQTRTVKLDPL